MNTVAEVLKNNPEKLKDFDSNKECYREETEYFQNKSHVFGEHQIKIRKESLRRDEILVQKLQLFSLTKCAKILTGKSFYVCINTTTFLNCIKPRLFLLILPIISLIGIIYASIAITPECLLFGILWIIGCGITFGVSEGSDVFDENDLRLNSIDKLIIRLPFGVALKYEEAMNSKLFDDVVVLAPISCWKKEVYTDPLLLGKIGNEYAILAQW